MRQIITITGRILLFIIIALLTFVTVLLSITNPLRYIRVFKSINQKASNFMNAFRPVSSEDDIAHEEIGEYVSLIILLIGFVILLLSLKRLLA